MQSGFNNRRGKDSVVTISHTRFAAEMTREALSLQKQNL